VSRIRAIDRVSWTDAVSPVDGASAEAALESGAVLWCPALAFQAGAREIFSPAILSSSKNASFDPATGHVGGTTLTGAARDGLAAAMAAFSDAAQSLVRGMFPAYRGAVVRARASFRPAEIAGRETSWRKDDTRLHVDAFPASPVQGQRILRVFSNVNPDGKPRSWRVGPAFDAVASRFADALSLPWPGSALALRALKITKSYRTPYDALMLQLHDRMKADAEFQADCEQERFDFPAGSTWVAFTDQVSHAASAGQYQFEQTFLLPLDAMHSPSTSPLRVLERIKRRPLV
jgi:hypothetical protein